MLLVAVSSALKIGLFVVPLWHLGTGLFLVFTKRQSPPPCSSGVKTLVKICQDAKLPPLFHGVFHSGDHSWMVYFMENPMNLWMV
jgi:hypothetical protein